jgi:hypothetical protein
MITFSKDKFTGNWVMVGPETELIPGQHVVVSKKDGSQTTEIAGALQKGSFIKEGVKMVFCTIYKKNEADECIECGEPLYSQEQKRSGYCHYGCG